MQKKYYQSKLYPFQKALQPLSTTLPLSLNIPLTPEAVPIIEKLAWHYDESFADSSSVPTYYVSETARENVIVSLSGDGGDENFAMRRFFPISKIY